MKELKHLNILYITKSEDSEFFQCIDSKTSKLSHISELTQVDELLENRSFDILISEEIIKSEKLKEIRKYSSRMQVLIINENIDDNLFFEAIELQGIKLIDNVTNKEELKQELKEIIQILDSSNSNIVQLKDEFIYDRYNNTLLKDHDLIPLSKKEDMFLDYIINHQDRAVSYDELNDTLWKGEMTHNALRSVVKEVRKKTYKNLIKNISGVGYRVEI